MSARDEIADATGRPVRVGDTVGGTTSGRYQATIVGPVVKVGKGQVKVRADQSGHTYSVPVGTEKWISSVRVFLVGGPIRAEVLAEATKPADAATIYAARLCVCDDNPHPTWCPASVPTDERITEIRQGIGGPLTRRELSWLTGAAGRHELHVTGARGGHWPLTDDLPGALLLVSQYLAAAVAVIERAGLAEDEGKDTASSGESIQPTNPDECTCMPHRKFRCGHCDMDLCQDCGQCCGCDCAKGGE